MADEANDKYGAIGRGTGLLSFETKEIFEIPPSDGLGRCRDVNEFEKLGRIGQGSYGVVYKARDKVTGEMVSLKKVRMMGQDGQKDGLPVHAMREISLLIKYNKHENIVCLKEIVVSRNLESIFMVMEHCVEDLAAVLDKMKSPFPEPMVKFILKQLLQALSYLHLHFIVHRDVKLSNLLIASNGMIKLADFGLARKYCLPPEQQLTPGVVTLWYRAPELLLGAKAQTTAVDMWATGCVFGELLVNKPLLPGKSEAGQLSAIIDLLGAPSESIWPGVTSLPLFNTFTLKPQPYNNLKAVVPRLSDCGLRLLNFLFMYDPKKRATADDCLSSSYFTEPPLPCTPRMLHEFCYKSSGRSHDPVPDPNSVIQSLMSNLTRGSR